MDDVDGIPSLESSYLCRKETHLRSHPRDITPPRGQERAVISSHLTIFLLLEKWIEREEGREKDSCSQEMIYPCEIPTDG